MSLFKTSKNISKSLYFKFRSEINVFLILQSIMFSLPLLILRKHDHSNFYRHIKVHHLSFQEVQLFFQMEGFPPLVPVPVPAPAPAQLQHLFGRFVVQSDFSKGLDVLLIGVLNRVAAVLLVRVSNLVFLPEFDWWC